MGKQEAPCGNMTDKGLCKAVTPIETVLPQCQVPPAKQQNCPIPAFEKGLMSGREANVIYQASISKKK